jgi:glyoxylate/hydroxypyruvate reductase
LSNVPCMTRPPVLLFISTADDPAAWRAHLRAAMPELEMRVWPDAGDPADIDAALVWRHPPGALRRFPNLKLIVNIGAGVDYVFADPDLPPGVPIARIVDTMLTGAMTQYVVLHVLALHRRMPEIAAAQRAARWRYFHPPAAAETRVGLLGLGHLGQDAARMLARFGFPLLGWSRTPKSLPGVECHAGSDGLPAFLAGCGILVCLLPLTPATENLLDAGRFAQLPRGAAFVNAGRGRLVVEEDLLAALDSGQLRHAVLDVFREEPLPPESPFWRHPKVTLTPHNAAAADPRGAAEQVAENVRRVLAGRKPLNEVDPLRGY